MPRFGIGVDLGGTNLRAAAISSDGRVLDRIAGTTDLHLGRDAVVDDIVDSIQKLKAKCDGDLAGVGIGVPGFIDIDRGLIVGSHNLPEFSGFPVRDVLGDRLGTPVIFENDANAAALGEKWMGAGREVNDLILLTLGTGVGGGIISGGGVLHGFLGMAGEIGHTTVYPDGNLCGCGNRGCLEKHASATAITGLAQMLHLGDSITSEGVYKLACDGNDLARRIFESVGIALGIALASLINTFNFPLYLLGGGVAAAWDLFSPAMFAEARRRSFALRNTKTRIEKATLGKDAGLFGAAYLPMQTEEH